MGQPHVEPNYQIARFRLMLNCYNCRVPTSKYVVGVPDDVTTEDDLLESGVLEMQRFACSKCDCPVGTITGVKIEWLDVPY